MTKKSRESASLGFEKILSVMSASLRLSVLSRHVFPEEGMSNGTLHRNFADEDRYAEGAIVLTGGRDETLRQRYVTFLFFKTYLWGNRSKHPQRCKYRVGFFLIMQLFLQSYGGANLHELRSEAATRWWRGPAYSY